MGSARRRALLLVALAAAVSLFLGTQLFPYLTTNHDEAVYLQQAAMLLDGQVFLYPPLDGVFHPWFFVDAGEKLYPKYAPVPAAIFALGKLLGGYRIGLALVAATVVAGTYGVTREVFADRDDRELLGLGAAVFVLASPLFLVQTAVFLPYAPTAALNLGFAYGYLRADRTGRLRWAVLAGAAVGTAFFARPYTAVLFALPFVAHALWRLRSFDHAVLARNAVVAALGLLGVAVTLGYNAHVTGAPLTFPYEAFAPEDGLGFGHREILGYERDYDPALALRANAEVVAQLFGRWVAAGVLGSALAAIGLGVGLRGVRGQALARRAALAGTLATVVLGNVYFWGNLNILGALGDPTDGLIHLYGPFYHFDLLAPTGAFAALGARTAWTRLRTQVRDRAPPARTREAVAAVALVAAAVLTAAGGLAVAAPVSENAAVTAQLEEAYDPFEGRDFEDAVVFLPTPYGDWLNHPFQVLRNDPGFDGSVVYAMDDRQFDVVDTYPDRTYYRYAFRGPWVPFAGEPVDARLQQVRHVRGDRIVVDASVGVPPGAGSVTLRLSTEEGQAYYVVENLSDRVRFDVVVVNGSARLRGATLRPLENGTVPVDDRDTVVANAFVGYRTGGFDYRIATPVQSVGGEVRALTPRLEVCHRPSLCGGEAAYVPGAHREGVVMNTTLVAEDKT